MRLLLKGGVCDARDLKVTILFCDATMRYMIATSSPTSNLALPFIDIPLFRLCLANDAWLQSDEKTFFNAQRACDFILLVHC
jgi:hypothetical protein